MGVWKTIKNGWEDFKDKISFKVGSGNRVKFWKDKWCEDMPLRDSFPDLYSITSSKDAWVVDVWDGGSALGLLDSWMTESWRKHVSFLGSYMIIPSLWVLMILWCGWRQKNAEFLVKSLYSFLASRWTEPFPYGLVWNSWAPIRASFFAWKTT